LTLLIGLVAQLLHVALIGAAAPTLIGVHRWISARLAGHVGASPLQPWWELLQSMRKHAVLAESASCVTTSAPAVCVAATLVAACLVPSFALGMMLAPFADLLLIAGLLMVARGSLVLAMMDAGTALGGMAASRSMLLVCLAEPALLLVLVVLALLAGTLNLDLIAGMRIESGANWRTGITIALAAMLLVALIDTIRHEALSLDLSGSHLALVDAAEALRLLVWFNLIGSVFLPFGMVQPGAGPVAWVVAIVAWLARTLLFTALLALAHTVLGRIRLVRAARILGVAVLLGLLAAMFVFADMGTA
jgi:formate hydrogenlyase subunit 4